MMYSGRDANNESCNPHCSRLGVQTNNYLHMYVSKVWSQLYAFSEAQWSLHFHECYDYDTMNSGTCKS